MSIATVDKSFSPLVESANTVDDSGQTQRSQSLPEAAEHKQAVSIGKLWTGRVLTGLTTLFMLFDAIGKFVKPTPAPISEAFARLGFPLPLAGPIAILLLVSTILYAVPRTAVLGAVLLTGYLGGAVAIQMRAGSSSFETVFPVLFGIIAWAGIFLRERRLLEVFPLRRTCGR